MAEKRTIELEVKESGFKSLKAQLREAQADVAALSDKFGATSDQAIAAARSAAILKDKIGDAKTLTDAYNPDAKFKALTGALSGAANGFQAVQGAMGLVGVESAAVEETLLKVQSAMAFAQGIDGVLESVDSFKTLAKMLGIVRTAKAVDTAATATQATVTTTASLATGKMTLAQKALNLVMKANPIFLIIGGIAALVTAYALFSSSQEDATKTVSKLNDELDKQNVFIEEQKKRLDNATRLELARAKERGDSEETLLKIKEKSTQKQVDLAYKNYIDTQKAYDKIWALRRKDLVTDEDFNKAKQREQESYDKWFDAVTQKNIADAERDADNAEKAREKAADKAEDARRKAEAAAKAASDKRKADLLELNKFIADATKANLDGAKSDQQVELDNIELKYQEQLALATKYGKDSTQLIEAQKNEENIINTKYAQIEIDIEQAKQDKLDELAITANQNRINSIDSQFELERSLTESALEKELMDLTIAYDAKYLIAEGNAELIKSLDEQYAKDKAVINKTAEDKEIALANESRDKKLQMAASAFDALGSLAGAFSAKNETDARKQFKVQKAFNIASAITNTALAVTGALTAGGNPIKLATGMQFVEAGIAAVSGAAAVANIAKTQFNGGGTDTPAPPTGGGGAPIAPSFNIVGNSGINQLAELGGQPIQAYVVSGEVTSAQALDRNRIQNATF